MDRLKKFGGGVLILCILAAIVIPRIIAPGRFVTADEPDWGKRSANFYYALTNQDYTSTYQIEHPGVTTMWLGAAAFHLSFPEYQYKGQETLGDTKLLLLFQRQGPLPLELLATARILLALTISLALIVSLLYARRLYPTLAVVLGFLLISLDTFQIGHSRVLHTNGLLSAFMFLSVIAFLHFLQYRRWHALVISGIGAGLGILTVLPGIFLIPVIVLISVLDLLFAKSQRLNNTLKSLIHAYGIPLILWGVIILLIYILLWPAMWVDPFGTLADVARPLMGTLRGSQDLFASIGDIGSTMGEGSNPILFYIQAYLWRSSPLVIFGIVIAFILLLTPKSAHLTNSQRKNTIALFIFAVTFVLLMSMVEKKSDRYILPIFPVLDLIAGVGWVAALTWLSRRYFTRWADIFQYVVVVSLVLIQLGLTIIYYPYYLTYYNPLLGRADEIPDDMFAGWGEGLNEAAIYLQEVPNIREKRILSWYPQVFNWYSQGLGLSAETMYLGEEVGENRMREYLEADYVVIYINQWQRNRQRELLDYLEDLEPVHTVQLNGVDYAKIYNLKSAK